MTIPKAAKPMQLKQADYIVISLLNDVFLPKVPFWLQMPNQHHNPQGRWST